MKPVYLIACSAAKLDREAPAAQLYTGQAFKLAMAAAERAGAEVLILSALHGVIEPLDWVKPYNRAMHDMSAHQRKIWAAMTADNLRRRCLFDRAIVVLAGKHYAAALDTFPNVSRPLAGQGIGQQLHTLKSLTN